MRLEAILAPVGSITNVPLTLLGQEFPFYKIFFFFKVCMAGSEGKFCHF